MKSTFSYRQELRSLEFGNLLFDIIPSGVYKAPVLSIVDQHVQMNGGTFLIKNNSTDEELKEFIIRISFDPEETLTTAETVSEDIFPQYVWLEYTYTQSIGVQPSIKLGSTKPSEPAVLIARINRGAETGYTIDQGTTVDMRGPGISYSSPAISNLEYSPTYGASGTGTLTVSFSTYFNNNQNLATVQNLSVASVEVAKSYGIYIDQTGTPKLITPFDSTHPAMGRNILAYKAAGDRAFTIPPFPLRAEITADTLSMSRPTTEPSANKTTLKTLYDDSTIKNENGEIVLDNVIYRLVAEIQRLTNELDTLTNNFNTLKNKVDGFASNFATSNLTVSGSGSKVDFSSAELNFSGAKLDLEGSTLGSNTKPIDSMYINNVLYARNIKYFTS